MWSTLKVLPMHARHSTEDGLGDGDHGQWSSTVLARHPETGRLRLAASFYTHHQ